MPKIPSLPAITTVDGADLLPIEDVSVSTTKKITLSQIKNWLNIASGWVDFSPVTLTYASATSFTTSVNLSGVLSKGDKIWLNQSGSKYFVVVSVSGTTVNVTGGSDYTLANAAITAPYFSKAASPYGFPQWFNYTPTWTGFSVNPQGTFRFRVDGTMVTVFAWMQTAGTSNAGTFAMTVPITAANITNALWMCSLPYREDNGGLSTTIEDYGRISANTNTLNLYKNSSSTGWTSSGNKRAGLTIQYEF